GPRPKSWRRRGHEVRALRATELAKRLRQAEVVAAVLDGLSPTRSKSKEMRRHAVAGDLFLVLAPCRSRIPTRRLRHVERVLRVNHPQLAALPGFVNQPHRARVAPAFFDHILWPPAEKSLEARPADP